MHTYIYIYIYTHNAYLHTCARMADIRTHTYICAYIHIHTQQSNCKLNHWFRHGRICVYESISGICICIHMQNIHHDMYIRHTYIYILILGATSQCAETTTVNPPPPFWAVRHHPGRPARRYAPQVFLGLCVKGCAYLCILSAKKHTHEINVDYVCDVGPSLYC